MGLEGLHDDRRLNDLLSAHVLGKTFAATLNARFVAKSLHLGCRRLPRCCPFESEYICVYKVKPVVDRRTPQLLVTLVEKKPGSETYGSVLNRVVLGQLLTPKLPQVCLLTADIDPNGDAWSRRRSRIIYD